MKNWLTRKRSQAVWRRALAIRGLVREIMAHRRAWLEAIHALKGAEIFDVLTGCYAASWAYQQAAAKLERRLKQLTLRPITEHSIEEALGHPQWLVVYGDSVEEVRFGRQFDLPDHVRLQLLQRVVELHIQQLTAMQRGCQAVHHALRPITQAENN